MYGLIKHGNKCSDTFISCENSVASNDVDSILAVKLERRSLLNLDLGLSRSSDL